MSKNLISYLLDKQKYKDLKTDMLFVHACSLIVQGVLDNYRGTPLYNQKKKNLIQQLDIEVTKDVDKAMKNINEQERIEYFECANIIERVVKIVVDGDSKQRIKFLQLMDALDKGEIQEL